MASSSDTTPSRPCLMDISEEDRIPEARLEAAKKLLKEILPVHTAVDIWTLIANENDPNGIPWYPRARKWKELAHHQGRCGVLEDDISIGVYARFIDHPCTGTKRLEIDDMQRIIDAAQELNRNQFEYSKGVWTKNLYTEIDEGIYDKKMKTKVNVKLGVDLRWTIQVHDKASQETESLDEEEDRFCCSSDIPLRKSSRKSRHINILPCRYGGSNMLLDG